MGFILLHCFCANCGSHISVNPNHCPSVMVAGKRMAVCGPCIEAANPERIANGLEAFVIHPEAYEPLDENEAHWDG
jgi:hypothetical protein